MMAGSTRLQSAVSAVDHVLLLAVDAEGAYDFLTRTLALPPAWPPMRDDGLTSAGVRAGNCDIAIVRAEGALMPWLPEGHCARWLGISFTGPGPADALAAELDQREIRYHQPEPGHAWTAFWLRGLLGPHWLSVWALPPDQPRPSISERRRSGGILGIERVSYIEVQSVASDLFRSGLSRLLAPTPAVLPGVWLLDSGPGLRVVPADQERVVPELEVKDLDLATDLLDSVQMAGSRTADWTEITCAALTGAPLRLTASPPNH